MGLRLIVRAGGEKPRDECTGTKRQGEAETQVGQGTMKQAHATHRDSAKQEGKKEKGRISPVLDSMMGETKGKGGQK